ncbi:hypothetical protein EYD10_01015 [Varanus komodoensis]|nr:hypothetical protein EYD10_01015 [Varanus komodoensis]
MSTRRRHVGNRANPDPNCCLGVFGLSLYTTERDLREVFSKYGPIADVSIVYDQQSRRSRGFAFVYFESVDDAKEEKITISILQPRWLQISLSVSIIFTSYVQRNRQGEERDVQLLSVDGKIITDSKEKAEMLNTYSGSVFSQKKSYDVPDEGEVQTEGAGSQLKIDRQIIKDHLIGLNKFKLPGPVELHPRFIKELAEELSKPVPILFEKSCRSGEEPDH